MEFVLIHHFIILLQHSSIIHHLSDHQMYYFMLFIIIKGAHFDRGHLMSRDHQFCAFSLIHMHLKIKFNVVLRGIQSNLTFQFQVVILKLDSKLQLKLGRLKGLILMFLIHVHLKIKLNFVLKGIQTNLTFKFKVVILKLHLD